MSDMLLSASYDMTCRVWTDSSAVGVGNSNPNARVDDPMTRDGQDGHTEFVTGVDWCMFGAEGWCASTRWDKKVLV
jgi:peroxin-7